MCDCAFLLYQRYNNYTTLPDKRQAQPVRIQGYHIKTMIKCGSLSEAGILQRRARRHARSSPEKKDAATKFFCLSGAHLVRAFGVK
jgi:hypothetical protein